MINIDIIKKYYKFIVIHFVIYLLFILAQIILENDEDVYSMQIMFTPLTLVALDIILMSILKQRNGFLYTRKETVLTFLFMSLTLVLSFTLLDIFASLIHNNFDIIYHLNVLFTFTYFILIISLSTIAQYTSNTYRITSVILVLLPALLYTTSLIRYEGKITSNNSIFNFFLELISIDTASTDISLFTITPRLFFIIPVSLLIIKLYPKMERQRTLEV